MFLKADVQGTLSDVWGALLLKAILLQGHSEEGGVRVFLDLVQRESRVRGFGNIGILGWLSNDMLLIARISVGVYRKGQCLFARVVKM